MDAEGVIIGAVSVIWGVILAFTRPLLLEFSREGGRGLRDRRVINSLVIVAAVFLCAGGTAVILSSVL